MGLRVFLCLGGLWLGVFSARAQTFGPGLLTLSTGDTLRGELENGFWTEPPTFIRSRSGPAAPDQLL